MAQDVIVKKDQTTIMSKVLEITSTVIKYKKWSNQDGPTYSIDKSEVLSINFENGEVEYFSIERRDPQRSDLQQNRNNNTGFMEVRTSIPATLKLNGHPLSAEEVRGLVNEHNYQLYLQGEKQTNVGRLLDWASLFSFMCAGAGLMGYADNVDKNNSKASIYGKLTIATSLTGTAFLIPGIILSNKGSNKLEQVAKDYNQAQNRSYSINFSPSFMNCEIPQSQSNYGLGLTISMNF